MAGGARMSLVRSTPEERSRMSRWLRWMAAMSAVFSAGCLAIVRPDSPLWQWVVGFVLIYAVGWISPPVWLAAWIGEEIAESIRKRNLL